MTVVVRRLGVVAFKRNAQLTETARALRDWAQSRGIELLWHRSSIAWIPSGCKSATDTTFLRRCDAVLSIGGDGTLLSAARLVAGRPIPLVGLNYGRLGFLADLSAQDGFLILDSLVAGKNFVEERTALEAVVRRGRLVVHRDRCLNEFFLRGRRDLSMVEIEVRSGGRVVCDYWADGLLVATPTGSTAYSLAVGGPIVEHSVRCLILTPVAPHSLNVRPLLLADDRPLVLKPREGQAAQLLSDGRNPFLLHRLDEVHIGRSERPVLLLRPDGASFSDALRDKLGWSASPPPRSDRI
ncbi:MAG: NAD(+)/NADH kinase [Fibrobacterota bacterium]|nr:NAD(+)/NADH kinase [Fibrobacterota bacterium]QQS03333.1 MAG: NAD(+)/NADH kinase [Fibrobacterota bacterium]